MAQQLSVISLGNCDKDFDGYIRELIVGLEGKIIIDLLGMWIIINNFMDLLQNITDSAAARILIYTG